MYVIHINNGRVRKRDPIRTCTVNPVPIQNVPVRPSRNCPRLKDFGTS